MNILSPATLTEAPLTLDPPRPAMRPVLGVARNHGAVELHGVKHQRVLMARERGKLILRPVLDVGCGVPRPVTEATEQEVLAEAMPIGEAVHGVGNPHRKFMPAQGGQGVNVEMPDVSISGPAEPWVNTPARLTKRLEIIRTARTMKTNLRLPGQIAMTRWPDCVP